MSVFILGANKNYGAQYNVPLNGVIRFEVEAQLPITAVVMDEPNFAAFRQGLKYSSWGPATQATEHKQQWTLPFRGKWFLVMINRNPQPAAVSFKAWS
jgi:hypothetical protein